MEALIELLKQHKLTIGSVESLTGGLFASEMVKVKGASQVFKGSLVTYQNSIKNRLLGISELEINKYGVVSAEIAKMMAERGQEILDVDICVSFTGNAGPDVLEGKAVGLVYSCLKYHDDIEYCDQLSGDRNQIRNDVIELMITRIIREIEKGD